MMKEPAHQDAWPRGRPRWVTVFGIVALVLVAVVAVFFLRGGEHGPGRHLPGGDGLESHAPPAEHRP
jgi:hypothetical protein